MTTRSISTVVRICLFAGLLGLPALAQAQRPSLLGRTTQTTVDRQISQAQSLEKSGDLEGAERIYQSLLKRTPNSVKVHHRMAVLMAMQERMDEAADHFDVALDGGKPSPELLADYGFFCYLEQDFPIAEKFLRASLKHQPTMSRVRNNLALVLAEQDRFEEALDEFLQVQEESDALVSVAELCERHGKREEARIFYSAALDISPELAAAVEGMKRVQQLDPAEETARSKTAGKSRPMASKESIAKVHRKSSANEEAPLPPEFDLDKPDITDRTESDASEVAEAEADSQSDEMADEGQETEEVADQVTEESPTRLRVVLGEALPEDERTAYDEREAGLRKLMTPPQLSRPKGARAGWGVAYASDSDDEFADIPAAIASDVE